MRRVLALAVVFVALAACDGGGGSARPSTPPATDGVATPTATRSVTTTPPGARGGPVPAGFHPLAFSFISARTGFVLGATASCTSPPCTSMVRTTDAGRTWTGVPAPRTRTDSERDGVSQLAMADSLNGFAWGADLWSTHDGARTWKQVRVGGRVTALAIGSRRFFAVLDACGDQSGCGRPAQLVRGSVSRDEVAPVPGVTVPQGFRAGLVTHGPSVWLTGRGDGKAPPAFYASRDGDAFSRRTVPCDEAALEFDVAASGDVNLAGICGGEPATAMQDKQAFVSSDAGRTWTRVGDPPHTSGTEVVATGKGTFVTDSRTGVAVTRDGGKTWPYVLEDGTGGIHGLGFVNDDLGFLLDQQKLMVTRDAGRTWAQAL